jgi:hypothetical protein
MLPVHDAASHYKLGLEAAPWSITEPGTLMRRGSPEFAASIKSQALIENIKILTWDKKIPGVLPVSWPTSTVMTM